MNRWEPLKEILVVPHDLIARMIIVVNNSKAILGDSGARTAGAVEHDESIAPWAHSTADSGVGLRVDGAGAAAGRSRSRLTSRSTSADASPTSAR